MEGEPPYSPAVPEDLTEATPLSLSPNPQEQQEQQEQPAAETDVGYSRSLPAAEEVDILAQIETRDRAAAEQPRPLNAFLAGATGALVGAAAFGGLAGLGGCSYKTLVVGAGFLVAGAVRYFGKGRAPLFGYIGASWALVACAAACFLATCCDMARRSGTPAVEFTQGSFNWATVLHRAFGPAEFLWCAAAVVAAYIFSRRTDAAPKEEISPFKLQ